MSYCTPNCLSLSNSHSPIIITRDGVSYTQQLHSLRLLLAMLSTQLYTMDAAGPPGAHPFAEAILARDALITPLVQALLCILVQRPLPPRDAEVPAGDVGLGERKSSQGRKNSQGLARSACMLRGVVVVLVCCIA